MKIDSPEYRRWRREADKADELARKEMNMAGIKEPLRGTTGAMSIKTNHGDVDLIFDDQVNGRMSLGVAGPTDLVGPLIVELHARAFSFVTELMLRARKKPSKKSR